MISRTTLSYAVAISIIGLFTTPSVYTSVFASISSNSPVQRLTSSYSSPSPSLLSHPVASIQNNQLHDEVEQANDAHEEESVAVRRPFSERAGEFFGREKRDLSKFGTNLRNARANFRKGFGEGEASQSPPIAATKNEDDDDELLAADIGDQQLTVDVDDEEENESFDEDEESAVLSRRVGELLGEFESHLRNAKTRFHTGFQQGAGTQGVQGGQAPPQQQGPDQ